MNSISKCILGIGIFSLSAYITAWGMNTLTYRDTPNSLLHPQQVIQNTESLANGSNAIMGLIIMTLVLSSSVPATFILFILNIYDEIKVARKKLDHYNTSPTNISTTSYNQRRVTNRNRSSSGKGKSNSQTNQAAAAYMLSQTNDNCHSD